MDKKRIFIGIPISEELQEKILSWEKPFLKIPARWMPGEKLYITLVPSWYEDNVEAIKDKLRTIEGTITPFSFELENVMYGPHSQKPRLIWAKGKTPKELLELTTKLYILLERKEPSRPFRLHLTLARFRPNHFSSFPIKKLDEKIHWKGNAASINLIESLLLPGGAKYNVLLKVPFKKITT